MGVVYDSYQKNFEEIWEKFDENVAERLWKIVVIDKVCTWGSLRKIWVEIF